jgi:hypothetical protein
VAATFVSEFLVVLKPPKICYKIAPSHLATLEWTDVIRP